MDPNPYAPPAARGAPAPALLGYSTPGTLGRLAVIGMAVHVACEWAIYLINHAFEEEFAARQFPPNAYFVEQVLGWLGGGARLLGLVLFLVWIHRAAKNVKTFPVPPMSISPGWAVGWFFVPFAGIYMPFKAVSEIATRSDPEGNGVTPLGVIVWWVAFVGGNLLRTLLRAVITPTDFPAFVKAGTVNCAVATVAVSALWTVVRTISANQDATARSIATLGGQEL